MQPDQSPHPNPGMILLLYGISLLTCFANAEICMNIECRTGGQIHLTRMFSDPRCLPESCSSS